MSDFPPGYFFIRSVASGKVLDVNGGFTDPGTKVIVYGRKASNFDNQLWCYDNGFLVSKASGFVLEVPGYPGGGDIKPRTTLVINPRRERPESLNQLWAYNQQMLMPYDPKVAVTAKGGDFQDGNDAVVDKSKLHDIKFEWMFDTP